MLGPTKFKDEYIELVYKLALLGLDDVQMSAIFNVTERTFNNWKKNDDFFQSLKNGKFIADTEIAESLYKRAKGYDVTEKNGDKEFTRHIPSDVTACIFWLKNRQPKAWRDKHEITPDSGKDTRDAYLKALKSMSKKNVTD